MPLTVVIASDAVLAIIRKFVLFLLQALMNHLWFGKSLKEAVAAPVVFVMSDNAAQFESKFDQVTPSYVRLFTKTTHDVRSVSTFSPPLALQDVIQALKALGHKDQAQTTFHSVVNAVEEVDGCICAVSDARKLGEAAGY